MNNIEELTKKINEQVAEEVEKRVREAMVNLSSETIVQRLEDLIRENERLKTKQIQNLPYIQPIIGPGFCNHEYPMPWFGITPPPCKKCGQSADFKITCDTNLKDNEWYVVSSGTSIKL